MGDFSKNERFFVAVDYLFREKLVKNQKDLSQKLDITETSLSRIKKGKRNVSDETLRRMNEAFGGIFDMRYFRGQSDHFLLEPQEKPAEPPHERVKNDPQPIDHSSLINAMLAAKDETIAELRARIADKESQLADKDSQLADKEAIITAHRSQLADKEALIVSQQSLIAELRAKLSPRYDVSPAHSMLVAESETPTKLQKQ